MSYILFDIGGTTMRIASSKDGVVFSDPVIEKTPQNFNKGIAQIDEIIKKVSEGENIQAVAGGIAGVLDKNSKKLIRSPHLEDWEHKPLHDEIHHLTKAPVFIKNDTDMIGLGEAVLGAGKGYKIVGYITVSTGVGGTRIVDGKIDRYRYGFEPGHQILSLEGGGDLVSENMKTLEEFVSGSAMQEKYGKPPSTIDDLKLWDEKARELAVGIYNSIIHWSPDVLVLGGAMMLFKPGINIEKVKEYTAKIMDKVKIFPELPEIKLVTLGSLGGLHGSIIYLKQILEHSA